MAYVQFYNPRTDRWVKAERLRSGRLRIVETRKKKYKGVRVLQKKKRKKRR